MGSDANFPLFSSSKEQLPVSKYLQNLYRFGTYFCFMKLLLVEDNVELAENVCQYLTKEGNVCEVVSTIHDAEQKLSVFQYDILLLDLMLPDGSGLEVLRSLARTLAPMII